MFLHRISLIHLFRLFNSFTANQYAPNDIERLAPDSESLVVCADTYDVRFTFAYFENIYLNSELYNSSTYSEQIKPANVSFMYNYDDSENGGYYFLDNVEVGDKIFEPNEPKREGYEFTGWYKDAECSTKWDFSVSPEIEQGADFRLYAGWCAL